MHPAKMTSIYGVVMFLIGSLALVKGMKGATGAYIGAAVLVIMLVLAFGQRKGLRGLALLATGLGIILGLGGLFMGLKAFGVIGGGDPAVFKGSLQAAMAVVSAIFVTRMLKAGTKDHF